MKGRRRRGRRGRSNRGSTILWLVGAFIALAGAAGGAWYALENRPVQLDARNCPEGGPTAATLVVLDLTDPIRPAQMRRIRQEVERAVKEAPAGAMIALGTVRPIDDPNATVFSSCKPPDGEEATRLTENPRMIRERYETAFLKPLRAALDAMSTVGKADSSPIMETIQRTIAEAPGWSSVEGERRMVLVSDLLQYSDAFSLYGRGDWNDFRATPDYARLSRNLEGVEVDVLRLPRPAARVADLSAVDDFWAGYFDRQGARPPRVRIIGDL